MYYYVLITITKSYKLKAIIIYTKMTNNNHFVVSLMSKMTSNSSKKRFHYDDTKTKVP